jgi:bifunctional DNA-binding transcriptional regulator/antitoxin component of YhaV-PrlF toxin-antitoxin module
MSKSTDERGRLYLPKDVRDRFGEKYRIVELPSHVALFPVDDDPLTGLREAVGDAFEGTDSDELKEQARRAIAEEIETEIEARETSRGR